MLAWHIGRLTKQSLSTFVGMERISGKSDAAGRWRRGDGGNTEVVMA
jgi:hypothetical protein